MARQKVEDSLPYIIFRALPTWATVATVVASYVLLRYLLPALMRGSYLAQMGAAYAPMLTFVLALIALHAEADKYKRRRLMEQATGLDSLRAITWQQFEQLVGEAYRRQGYNVEETGGGGADGGVDLVLRRDGETVAVQCKRWRNAKVGAPTVRELRGAVARDKATRGIFVTCGEFTTEAAAEAKGQPPIELVNGASLLALVRQGQGQPLAAQPLALRVEAPSAVPACPRCGSEMVLKTAGRGANTGGQFWGCPAFPRCRGTRSVG